MASLHLCGSDQLASGTPKAASRMLALPKGAAEGACPTVLLCPARQAAAALAAAFPPRGITKLLAPEHTQGDRPLIERLVAEEYMLDIIHYWDGDRVECAVKLAQGPFLGSACISRLHKSSTPPCRSALTVVATAAYFAKFCNSCRGCQSMRVHAAASADHNQKLPPASCLLRSHSGPVITEPKPSPCFLPPLQRCRCRTSMSRCWRRCSSHRC